MYMIGNPKGGDSDFTYHGPEIKEPEVDSETATDPDVEIAEKEFGL
jgi:hypothetical protein